jgi:hypothetical protein
MAKKTSRAAKKPKQPAAGALPRVRVRMYRQGLGDCFLITFDAGGNEKHMLIDCGTLGATTTGVKLAKVVENIKSTTGGPNGHLDLLVATHEHLDHVSGFRSQDDVFKKMKIDRVWMAWTENPIDPLAQKIVKYKNDLGAALKQAAAALRSPSASKQAKASGAAIDSILGFFDDDGAPLGASKFSPTVDEAMDFIRKGTGAKTSHKNPGDGPIEESWLPGFRFFVLGPPRDEAALNSLGEHGSSQLYSLANGLRSAAMLFASGTAPAECFAVDGEEKNEFAASVPFDVRFRREATAPDTKQMFADYLQKDQWRQIDEDWLNVATDLALQLDSATNNTSLALAIERIADGKVLLFPADAQEGSWLSWHGAKMQWQVTSGAAQGTVKASDLLARTVFYKVGHHSSHNATAKGKGLEMMQSGKELTAFIPVDRAVALKRNPQGSWKMPARPLYRRLLEQCNGRVVRSDIGFAADPATAANKTVEKEFVGMATKQEWTEWTKSQKAAAHITIDPLFVDYVLE